MPLDPQIEAMLSGADSHHVPFRTMDLTALRNYVRQTSTAFAPLDVKLAEIRDSFIVTESCELPIRIYTPIGSGPFPITVFFHGGGWVVGDLDTQDMIARALSYCMPSVVVSVAYRLAPEHPYPAAADDAFAATQWVYAEAARLCGKKAPLIVAGDSAGANLAAGVALQAKTTGAPPIQAQILFYGSANYPSERTASTHVFADGPIITADDVEFFWSQYLPDPGQLQQDPRVSPIRAPSHQDLPPAYIATAECDPTRDDAENFGRKLLAAGVVVEMHRFPGMPHGFVSWLRMVPAAQIAIDEACAFVRKVRAET